MAIPNDYTETLINRHNDENDELEITNFNLANSSNISMRSTDNAKGENPIELDITNKVIIFRNQTDNQKGTYESIRYVSLEDVVQITTRLVRANEPGKLNWNW